MKYFSILFAFFILLSGCTDGTKDKDTNSEEKDESLPEMSIYQLPGTWTNQDGEDLKLEELRGNVLAMVMIYTTCKAACPRLIADMKSIEEQVPDNYDDEGVKYIFVSIDPETDTVERLHNFAKEKKLTDDKWIFLRSNKENTREFATVLAVNYKRISPMDFSHSNIISVFDRDGVMRYQREGLSVAHDKTVKSIIELANKE